MNNSDFFNIPASTNTAQPCLSLNPPNRELSQREKLQALLEPMFAMACLAYVTHAMDGRPSGEIEALISECARKAAVVAENVDALYDLSTL